MVNSTCSSSIGPGFVCQNPYAISKQSITLVSGNSYRLLTSVRAKKNGAYTYVKVNTHIHKMTKSKESFN